MTGRRDWGIVRAIGGSSNDISWIIRIEGVILAAPASFFGALSGLVIAGLMMSALDAFFVASFGVGFSFAWDLSSVILGATGVFFYHPLLSLSRRCFYLGKMSSQTFVASPFSYCFWTLAGFTDANDWCKRHRIMGDVSIGTDTTGGLDHLLWISGGALLILTIHLPLSIVLNHLLHKIRGISFIYSHK